MKRTASATWYGDLPNGRGEVSSDSGVLSSTPYSFATRFENEKGTNPEELIGAAHAGCFSMALSMILGQHGATPERIDTTASVSLDKVDGGFAITKIHLDTRVEASGLDADAFEEATNAAKAGCPVSKALDVEITLSATLVTD
jgi:osmotically inducible protein OsmC